MEDLADLLPDPLFDGARKRYHKMDLQSHDANARAYEAEQRAREAAERRCDQGRELAALAGELARAQSDLRTATERENLARQEAQAACAQMLAARRTGPPRAQSGEWTGTPVTGKASPVRRARHGEEMVAAWSART